MKSLKMTIAALTAVVFGGVANANPPAKPMLPLTQADSTACAVATTVGGFFQNGMERQFPGDDFAKAKFVEGLKKVLSASEVENPYLQGVSVGLNLLDNLNEMRASGMDFSNEAFADAFFKVLDGQRVGFDAESANAYLDALEQQSKAGAAQEQQAFLDAQRQREGVIATPSGLLFEVITEGEGETPTINDTVEVKYTGRLADGSVFDSSNDETVKFPVGRLIPGFTEGLLMMKPGGTYRLFIPSSIGYGDNGAGPIPGGAALDFTVTLVGIDK